MKEDKLISETKDMKDHDFEQIDSLMERLRAYLGGHRFCIVHGTAGELFSVGIYNDKGEMISCETAPTIKEACDKLNSQTNEK